MNALRNNCPVCSRSIRIGEQCCETNYNRNINNNNNNNNCCQRIITRIITDDQNSNASDRERCEEIRRIISSRPKYNRMTTITMSHVCKGCGKNFGYNHVDAAGKGNKYFDLIEHKNEFHNGNDVDFDVKYYVYNPHTGKETESGKCQRDWNVMNNVGLWINVLRMHKC